METFHDAADWSNDNIWIRLQHMTHELLKCIRIRHLKQYFYPDCNLLQSKDTKELDNAAVKIEDFLNDPLKYIALK